MQLNRVVHYSACIARLCVAWQSFRSDAMTHFFMSHKPDFFFFFFAYLVCTRQSILAVDCHGSNSETNHTS